MIVVVPIENIEPDAGKQVAGTEPSTRSFAEALKLTGAPEAFTALTVILEGNVNTGGIVSTTVTVKLPLAVLPATSVAEQLTMVEPNPKVDPEAGTQETTGCAGFVSSAVAV